MDGNKIAELLKTNLQAALPDRVVTRNAVDPAARDAKDLCKGIYTIVVVAMDGLDAMRDYADLTGTLRLLIAGDIKLDDNANGEDVEQAEFALFRDLFDFVKAPGAELCQLNIVRAQLSGQTQAPYGWILAEVTHSELD